MAIITIGILAGDAAANSSLTGRNQLQTSVIDWIGRIGSSATRVNLFDLKRTSGVRSLHRRMARSSGRLLPIKVNTVDRMRVDREASELP
jgi:hypothetical protein